MENKPYTAIVHDKRILRRNNSYTVKLRVTYQRKQKYYSTGYILNEDDFQKVMGIRPRDEYKEIRIHLNKIEERAIEVIKELSEFGFKSFEERFFTKKTKILDVFSAYESYIQKLSKEGRAGTASNYQCSLNSLRSFVKKKTKLYFEEVTKDFLQSYENWMIKNGNSSTSVGIYLRCLRALFNEAIEEGVMKRDLYPFGKRKYQIPASRNIKKALSLVDIGKIYNYKAEPNSTR